MINRCVHNLNNVESWLKLTFAALAIPLVLGLTACTEEEKKSPPPAAPPAEAPAQQPAPEPDAQSQDAKSEEAEKRGEQQKDETVAQQLAPQPSEEEMRKEGEKEGDQVVVIDQEPDAEKPAEDEAKKEEKGVLGRIGDAFNSAGSAVKNMFVEPASPKTEPQMQEVAPPAAVGVQEEKKEDKDIAIHVVPERLTKLPIFNPDYTTSETTLMYASLLGESDPAKQNALAHDIACKILDQEPPEMAGKVFEIRLAVDQMARNDLYTAQDRERTQLLDEALVNEIKSRERWDDVKKGLTYATVIGGLAAVAGLPSAPTAKYLGTRFVNIFKSPEGMSRAERLALTKWMRALDEGASRGKWDRVAALESQHGEAAFKPISEEYKAYLRSRAGATGQTEALESVLSRTPNVVERSWAIGQSGQALQSLARGEASGSQFFEKVLKEITNLNSVRGVKFVPLENPRQAVRFAHGRDVTPSAGLFRRGVGSVERTVEKGVEKLPASMERAIHTAEAEMAHGVESVVDNVVIPNSPRGLKFERTSFSGLDVAVHESKKGGERIVFRIRAPGEGGKVDTKYVGVMRDPDAAIQPAAQGAAEGAEVSGVATGEFDSATRIAESAPASDALVDMKLVAERVRTHMSETLTVYGPMNYTRTGLRLQQLSPQGTRVAQALAGGLLGLALVSYADNKEGVIPGDRQLVYDQKALEDLMSASPVLPQSTKEAVAQQLEIRPSKEESEKAQAVESKPVDKTAAVQQPGVEVPAEEL